MQNIFYFAVVFSTIGCGGANFLRIGDETSSSSLPLALLVTFFNFTIQFNIYFSIFFKVLQRSRSHY